MNREQIRAAIDTGSPFTILMADGKEYDVPHSDFISLPPRGAYVIVYDPDRDGYFTVLSMLTMTGLRRSESTRVKDEDS